MEGGDFRSCRTTRSCRIVRYCEGKLRPRIDRALPLERAAEAMSAIADRSVQERIVLQVR